MLKLVVGDGFEGLVGDGQKWEAGRRSWGLGEGPQSGVCDS